MGLQIGGRYRSQRCTTRTTTTNDLNQLMRAARLQHQKWVELDFCRSDIKTWDSICSMTNLDSKKKSLLDNRHIFSANKLITFNKAECRNILEGFLWNLHQDRI
ncbi:hypothetical protein XENORESO_007268 [Xenotaenia resolanae]|uniref:Uncharacterized protein n=1 Tax=Xenotaenia resolanae TaxID=208358 RepID=A0ABV0VYK2_9TELE